MAEKIDYATISYLLGVVSIVFAFFSPIAGLVFGIIGLVKSNKLKLKEAKKLNVIGIILSIIFIIISIVLTIYSYSLGLNDSFPIF